ncbi:MAG: DUF5050 domain-containing protein [Clostridia bacterium]|nr:DUF5050 domain-containing protein [Clostridia bacterium]
MKIDLLCPAESRGVTVKTNSSTGEPYALFRLFNLSDKVIDSIKFTARAYDAYGKELGSIPIELNELDGQPKSPFAVNKGVSLAEISEARHVVADINEVIFADGEVYTVTESNMTEVNYIQPDYEEVTRLKSVAGSDAACYAQDPGPYWLCVCSRPNKQEDTECIRCGRDKQMVLNKFSSHDKINKAIEDKRLEEERAELERLAEVERQKELKRKKNAKIATITGICVAGAAVLAIVAWLVYGFVVTKIADSKVLEGNYIEAYDMYRSVNSKNIGNASEKAKGNSFANMVQSGILTADEENLYYINGNMNIVKENKASGEKTTLGESQGVSLSISGEWLYYVDAMAGELCRIKTDGSITESVMDSAPMFYTTIGNDLYYIAEDTESAQVTAQNQQAQQQMSVALFLMDTQSKKSKKISDASIFSLEFYKGKIYYIDSMDEHKLYVMDADGKNARRLVDAPMYGFTICDDKIYYSNGTMPSEDATMPNLTLEAVSLDGKTTETVVSDKKVSIISADSGKIYFTTYDDSVLYQLDTETKAVSPTSVTDFNVFNIADGYINYMSLAGEMFKVKTDGSAPESIGSLNPMG